MIRNFRQVARVPIGRTETERRLRKKFVKKIKYNKEINILYSKTNIKMKLPELKSLLLHNNLKKGNTQLNKSDIVKLLVVNNIITGDNLENKKQTSLDVVDRNRTKSDGKNI